MRYGYGPFKTKDNIRAQQALAGALTGAKRGPGAPKREQRSGRIDTRRLHRVGIGDLRVFTQRRDPAPVKVRAHILMDASASMGGWLSETCMQVARDLAGATELLSHVSARVSAFSTGYGTVEMYSIWESGQPTKNVDMYDKISMGGTMEGFALHFELDKMLMDISPREQGVLIIVSDGGPSEPTHVKSVVRMANEQGIPVVSVALNASAQQPLMYGRDNVVYYNNNAKVLARDIAKVMGRVL